jgi:hypothetical protein
MQQNAGLFSQHVIYDARSHEHQICLEDSYPKLQIYISELILDSYGYRQAARVKMNCMI